MSTGNLLGGAAGGVAGYFAAGALGVSVGGAIIGGAIIGSLLGGLSSGQKMVMEYGKLSSRNWQGSEYGGDIPRGYGTFPATGSQIVWLEHNKLKEVVKKKKSGGKGGGGGTVTKTYTYFATFALMLCQGEVAGVRRIWCGDKLIYNAGSDDLETIIASNQAAKGWKLYTGTADQLPDPRYEADVGVGNAPAFRGYTYIAFYDFALKDYSNTLQAAQFKVELLTVADVVGLRRVGVSTGRSENFAFAHVKNVDSYLRVSERAAGVDYTYSLDGASTGVSMAQFPVIPAPTDRYYVGYIDGSLISVKPGDTTFEDGALIRVGDPSNSFSSALPQSEVLYGCALNASMSALLVITGSMGPGGNKWFLIDSSGSVLKSGTMAAAVDVFDIGFGNVASFHYASASLEDDLEHLWVAYGAGQGDVWLYQIDGDVMSVKGRLFGGGGLVDWSFSRVSILANNGFAAAFYDDNMVSFVRSDLMLSVEPALADVIAAECSLSRLITPTDLDTSLLTQTIKGYRVSGGTIRSVIEPLQGAYPFDVVPSGYKIKFVPRGQAPVVTIPWEDLAAANSDEIGDSLPYSREMDSQLPQKVTITALSSTREYGAATQSYERMNTSAVNVEQRDIPLVLSDDEIAQMAEKLLFLRWLERDDFSYSLPPTYLALEPADVVTVQAKFGTFELRSTEINYESDGRLTCKAKANSAPLYTSNAVGAPGPGPSGEIGLTGKSLWVPMDIPVVNETIQNTPGAGTAVTGYTEGWPGAVLVSSPDGGQTYNEIQAYVGRSTIGTCRTSLAANTGALIDQSSIRVDLLDGELSSITLEQMIAGANYAAYGNDGRWEIVRFQNAALQGDGSYIVSSFVRGDKGTEWATGTHQLGDYFIPLDDPDNLFIGLPVESIALERLYRAVTSGDDIDSAADQAFTYQGVNLKPLSGAYPSGVRNGSGDLTASWTRRSRLGSTWWWTGIPAPVGEASEAYEVDVMSGSTVKRTISSTTPSISYTAAQQTTDFGSAQASITLRIYQLSTVVGRGYPLEVTL
ncbi:phage tail protein [Pseudomonas nitroreducens]|uniref:phage tail protein n=1 Tax=Pseudomonas nitroreducens TaxID=46680 RepID=UPI00351CDECF